MSSKVTDLDTASTPKNLLLYGVESSTDKKIESGVANGIATLGSTGKLDSDQVPVWEFNAQTGTTYTFALSDAAPKTIVTLSNTSTIAATIPPNSTIAFPIGAELNIIQWNTGRVTITAGLGVTIVFALSATSRTRYSGLTCVQQSLDTWWITGDAQ